MGRTLIGALVAGILVFLWGWVSHGVLPIKDEALRPLPGEDEIVRTLRGGVGEAGMYAFPFPETDASGEVSEEAMAAFEAKYEAGPRGLVVFDTAGGKPMSAARLGTELASNVLAALIAAMVLSISSAGLFGRVLIVTAMGLFAWISIAVSQWNWYGFSDAFTAMEAIDQVGGWLLGGIALALFVRPAHQKRV